MYKVNTVPIRMFTFFFGFDEFIVPLIEECE
jgi:hypothetical protein